MDSMFKNCKNLIFFDLSNFNTSSVKKMNYINYIFNGFNTDFVYCLNNNTSNKLISKINSYNFTNNCSNICFDKHKKIIYDIKKCVFNCTDDYKIEYKDICYTSCPGGSPNINNMCITNNNIAYDNYSSSSSINYRLTSLYISYLDYFQEIIKIKNTLNNKDNIIINIESELIKNNLDLYIENTIIKENKDLLIEENKVIYQLISTYNQNNNEYNNISIINLGE